ncbi:MAG: TIGR03790 family protein, partial [Verrucomicrobia bacterium]|nr:TIGR03790 family protein [Verrucomicrobiota bacterium]
MRRFRRFARFVSAALGLASTVAAQLAGSAPASARRGADVVVVYNSNQPASRALGLYYAKNRGVPPAQVIGLPLPAKETVSREEFEKLLDRPLLDALERKGLARFESVIVPAREGRPGRVARVMRQARMRYIVLCRGVPLRIAPRPREKSASKDSRSVAAGRDEAAVDSELACLPLRLAGLQIQGPARNPAFGLTNRLLLGPGSGVFLVARLDGPGESVARGLVDGALLAERRGLWGRGYFDLRRIKSKAYKKGDDWIEEAFRAAVRRGFECVKDVGPKTFPAETPAPYPALYAGWYARHANGPWARPGVRFVPGAVAYHIHSFSASTLRSESAGWAGPLVAKGAAATIGYVYEPYLGGTADVGRFFRGLLEEGLTFGEAAYTALPSISWQATVVGDPLYRPFPRGAGPESAPTLDAEGMAWRFVMRANLRLREGAKPAAVAAWLR